MQRLPIYRGIERNSRTFRGKESGNAFSVTRTDWELYLQKFFKHDDRFYTEQEWRTILRNITIEAETLKSFYRNMTGMDYTGESFREMASWDVKGKENAEEWPGQSGLLRGIIVFYERFILFAGTLIGNEKVNMVQTMAA